MDEMVRVNRILAHPEFLRCVKRTEELEKDRLFCRHNMVHFLDVARIAWIMSREDEMTIAKERVYAAALLHDIGKYEQYENGTPHNLSSARLAAPILEDCGFAAEETEEILAAIESHRDASVKNEPNLRGLLYRADKASRACFACSANQECSWSDEKKNLRLSY